MNLSFNLFLTDVFSQAVIKESLRMHPSLCMPLERVTPPEGATVCGVELPPRTIVGLMAPLVNRNKDVFGEDADEFHPERWLGTDMEHLKLMDRTFFSVSRDHMPLPACVHRYPSFTFSR